MSEFAELMNRISTCSRPVEETWETLPESEQDAWRAFFIGYMKNVAKMSDEQIKEYGGAFAQLWELAHDYHRLYGPLWK